MRKVLSWMSILILIPLVACSLSANPRTQPPGAATPTLSNVQMQTQLAQLLTMMPTTTGQPGGQVPPTAGLPTLGVATETATVESTASAAAGGSAPPTVTLMPLVTDTPQPTPAAPTSTSTPSAGGGQAATATSTPQATKAPAGASTPLSPDNPAARQGAPASTDPMNSPSTWNWPIGSDGLTETSFTNGQQVIKALTTKDGWRMANPVGQPFTDIYLESIFAVKNTCHTDAAGFADHYGVVVRVPVLQQPNQGYLFGFNCNGQYSLRSWNWNGQPDRRQDMQMLIDWTTPKDKDGKNIIHSGANTSNVMGMMTIGSKLRLYANGFYLAEYDFTKNLSIPQLGSGYFGVFVGSRADTGFTIWVDQMSYWLNPQP